jgi:Pyrimidine dimer DNA glycosylase
MRLWTLHPRYLDAKGLVALWREGLLAKHVLAGKTRGYRHHPQLARFRAHPAPVSAINHYLAAIATEADERGYRFDRARIGPVRNPTLLSVNNGQLAFELAHLRAKLAARAPADLARLPSETAIRPHPLFVVQAGPIEPWEKGAA